MAELKWTNVNDSGANSAMSNYLNANQAFRESVMGIGNNLANFTNVMNEGDASNNRRIREENTQAIINRANSITSQEEMDKLIQSGALSNDALRQQYGWAIDMDKVNTAQANLAKDVYDRANNIDKAKDYNATVVEIDARIAQAKARGDNEEYQRLLAERAKLGSINTTSAMATDGYSLTKDIWDKQAKGVEAMGKNTASLDTANTALAQAQLNAQSVQQQINKWASDSGKSIQEFITDPTNLSNPSIAPYIQQYKEAMLGVEQARAQVGRVEEERRNIANLFGLKISDGSTNTGSNATAVMNRAQQATATQPVSQTPVQAPEQVNPTVSNSASDVGQQVLDRGRTANQSVADTTATNTGSTSETKPQYQAGTFESAEQELNKVRDQDGNVTPQQAFDISEADVVKGNNTRAKQRVTIDQVEDSTGILNVVTSEIKANKGKYTDLTQIEEKLRTSKDPTDKENHKKLVDLMVSSPKVYESFRNSINLQLNNPASHYAEEAENMLKATEAQLKNTVTADLMPEGDSSLFTPMTGVLEGGETQNVPIGEKDENGKQKIITLTRDVSEKGKEAGKRDVYNAILPDLAHQGWYDSSSGKWYHLTNGIKNLIDDAIDKGAAPVDVYRGWRTLQDIAGKGNEVTVSQFETFLNALVKHKHQIPEWRAEFRKQTSAITKGLNHPFHRDILKSELYLRSQNKTLDANDVMEVAKGIGVPLEGFMGKPALTAKEEKALDNAMAVLEKYTFNDSDSVAKARSMQGQYMGLGYSRNPEQIAKMVKQRGEQNAERTKRLDKIPKEIQREIYTVMSLGSPKQRKQIKAWFGIK